MVVVVVADDSIDSIVTQETDSIIIIIRMFVYLQKLDGDGEVEDAHSGSMNRSIERITFSTDCIKMIV